MKHLPALLAVLAVGACRAQTVSTYDAFSGSSLNASLWQVINQEGSALATATVSNGRLSVAGAPNRSGVASNARLTSNGAVEVDALGWSGTNQILQLYSGPGDFTHFVEFGAEGTASDGTPILHVWLPTGESFRGDAPVRGAISPTRPMRLRIERSGTTFRFYAYNTLVHTTTSSALDNHARVVLYGWNTSVSRWDNVALSGPSVSITQPAPGARITGPVTVSGTVPSGVSWTLSVGLGASPSAWTTLTSGEGPSSGSLASWTPPDDAAGPVSFRLRGEDASGNARSYWSTVTIAKPVLLMPFEGQIVGPSFPVVLGGDVPSGATVEFREDGATFATLSAPPYYARRVPVSDGAHSYTAVVTAPDTTVLTTTPVNVTVKGDLYGRNARVSDNGSAFVFPDGSVTVAVGQNDGYPWPDLYQLWLNGDAVTTENYVKTLRANGVNVMRIMMEYAEQPSQYLENPLGTYRPSVVAFWDAFLPMCERNGMTVLATPWDTFWMNQNWTPNPWNSANGGPVASKIDFITGTAARAAQKARFKFLIDRYGNSPAIFAWDLLNEFDIWWDASAEQRRAWIEDMAAYVQDYEYQRWGHRHMVTVSTAWNEPTGVIGDVALRHPRFEFANTHLYYGGTINDPANVIDPALSVNHGVKANLAAIIDGRPYTDSESGPIDDWIEDISFDTQYYHHMSWAHFASGGAGTGMRWPYRTPHYVWPVMHATQKAIGLVAASLDWNNMRVVNADARLGVNRSDLIAMGFGDNRRVLAWVTQDLRQHASQAISDGVLTVSGLANGPYRVRVWNAYSGGVIANSVRMASSGNISVPLPTFTIDLAVSVVPALPGDLSNNGALDLSDVSGILSRAAGLTATSDTDAAIADIDADGTLTVMDALEVARRLS
jgi:mannan endo-1,4-beta-mannosidase